MHTSEGHFTERREALGYLKVVTTATSEQQAEFGKALLTSNASDGEEPDSAEDELCNFLSPFWPGEHADDLLRVERMALYHAQVLPTHAQMSDLSMVREFIELVQAYVGAQLHDIEASTKKAPVQRRKELSGRAEADLIDFIDSWSPDFLSALRTVEKRAAYLQAGAHDEQDLAALLMYRELIDRVEAYVDEAEGRPRRKKGVAMRRQREEPSTSAN